MPRKQAFCARIHGHKGDCRTAEALADSRARQTARRKGVRLRDDPEARRRWGGLLCLSCNTALGQIERKTGLARAYLAAPPGRLLSAA
jgi:hypothetical protein